MAISIAVTTPYGIDLPDAYIRINAFSGDNRHVLYTVRTFASAQARLEERSHLSETSYSFEYAPGQGDILIVCYKDLMSREGFEKAVVV